MSIIKEVLGEMSEEILEKAAAFDRYLEILEDDPEGYVLKAAVKMNTPVEEQIRKAAAMERILAELESE